MQVINSMLNIEIIDLGQAETFFTCYMYDEIKHNAQRFLHGFGF